LLLLLLFDVEGETIEPGDNGIGAAFVDDDEEEGFEEGSAGPVVVVVVVDEFAFGSTKTFVGGINFGALDKGGGGIFAGIVEEEAFSEGGEGAFEVDDDAAA
jgi:hypothetical protein